MPIVKEIEIFGKFKVSRDIDPKKSKPRFLDREGFASRWIEVFDPNSVILREASKSRSKSLFPDPLKKSSALLKGEEINQRNLSRNRLRGKVKTLYKYKP